MPAAPSFLRRNRTVLVVVGVLAALVAASVALVDRARPDAAPTVRNTLVAESPSVDLAHPFTGTPAADWADGVAGIAPPAAAPVGSYGADQVAAGFERVRQLLVTERLDPAVLTGHDFGRVLTLLAPRARSEVDLSTPSQNAYLTATRVADGFTLLPVPPKVTGTMSAEQAPDGALVVHTNYVFAYAFAPEDPDEITNPMEIVTVDRFETDYTITDERWTPEDQGVWLTSIQGFGYAMACDAYERGELAPGYSEPPKPGADTMDSTRAFDPDVPIPTTSNC